MTIEEIFSLGSYIYLPSFADSIAQKSPRFEIVKIMKGGMGGCLKIKTTRGDFYAIKIILPELLDSTISRDRYIDELKIWRTVSMCDGVVEAIQIFKYNEIPCVISPWLENGELSSLMKIKDRTVFFNSIYRIASTLKWVYDNYGVIHRDLKPQNILVDKNYLTYVGDWGLSKFINSVDKLNTNCPSNQKSSTQDGIFLGTYAYASPEQLTGEKLDFRSDIFALGIIMYEWETGRHPFFEKDFNTTANNIVRGQFTKIESLSNSSHLGLRDVIYKCLQVDRKNRYSSYDELLNDIIIASKDVPSFFKYIPTMRSYSDILTPKSLLGMIKDTEANGVLANNSDNVFMAEQDDVLSQITIASEIASLGDYEKAYDIIRKVMPVSELIVKFPDLYLHQYSVINFAWILRNMGKIEDAVKWMELISNAKVLKSIYYENLSEFYLAKSDFNKALNITEIGLDKYPTCQGLLGNASIACSMLGYYNEAISFANRRIKADPGLHSYFDYGFLCYKWAESIKETNFPKCIELYRSALLYFRKALEYNPEHYASSLNIAIILFKLRRYSDSIQQLNSIDRNNVTEVWIAHNLLWGASPEYCLNFCEKAIKNYPNEIILKRIYAECLVDDIILKSNELDNNFTNDANWEFFSEIINDVQHRTESDFRYLAKYLYWNKKYEAAIELLKQAEKIYPNEWTYNYYKSYYLLSFDRKEEALNEAIIANKKAPWREMGLKLLSRCYQSIGDSQKAELYCKEYERIKKQKNELYESVKSI